MAMAFQLMNSIMYMIEYGIQCNSIRSPNYYNNSEFPLGVAMSERPFMYVNLFWLVMPTYIIFYEIFNTSLFKLKKYNSEKLERMDNEKTNLIQNTDEINYSEPPNYISDQE